MNSGPKYTEVCTARNIYITAGVPHL